MKLVAKYIVLIILMYGITSCVKEKELKDAEDEKIESIFESDTTIIFKNIGGSYIYYSQRGDTLFEDYNPEFPDIKSDSAIIAHNDSVKLIYTGTALQSNTQFAVNDTVIIIIGKTQIIEGWKNVLPHLMYRDKGILIVPFDLAYGKKQVGTIPPYSTLQFDFYISR